MYIAKLAFVRSKVGIIISDSFHLIIVTLGFGHLDGPLPPLPAGAVRGDEQILVTASGTLIMKWGNGPSSIIRG